MSARLVAISLKRGNGVTDDGRVIPIVNMFDHLNEATDRPDECCTFVAYGGPTEWFYGRADDFAGTVH